MPDLLIRLVEPPSTIRPICEAILRDLPEWFGIEASLVEYAEAAQRLATWIAEAQDEPIGFLSIRRHFDHAAEIHCIGVLKAWHGQGVGRALARQATDWLRERGVEFLHVKTLGPSRPCEHYERTRRFYEALGFRPLEEMRTLWNEANPCLMMVRSMIES